jgi:hypothetical protein
VVSLLDAPIANFLVDLHRQHISYLSLRDAPIANIQIGFPKIANISPTFLLKRNSLGDDETLLGLNFIEINTSALSHYPIIASHCCWIIVYLSLEFSHSILPVSSKTPSRVTSLISYSSSLICLMPMMRSVLALTRP